MVLADRRENKSAFCEWDGHDWHNGANSTSEKEEVRSVYDDGSAKYICNKWQ